MQCLKFESKNDLLEQIGSEEALPGSLLFIQSGQGTISINHQQLSINASNLFSLPLFAKIALPQATEAFSGWLLKFNNSERKELLVHSFPLFCPFTGIVQLNLSAENFNKFSFYLSELVQHQQQASLADKQLSRMLSVLIIKYLDLFIDGENSISQLTDPLLKRFVDSVGRGFRNNHNVEYYADQIGTTTKTLNRRLKETLGITPKDIINYRINSEAMRIFASNDTSVKEIAYQLGFNSPDYFHNFFKRLNKITPSNYKKQLTYAISDL